MKTNKSPGIDEIKTEMLKALDKTNTRLLASFFNRVYKVATIPGDMNDSIFLRIPEKLKAIACREFRIISLMSDFLKLIQRVILKRIKQRIEKEISDMQSCFMKGKGTREGIFNMRTICERYLAMNKHIYACFMDYEKAFDRMNHQRMIKNLQKIGIPGRDIKFIRNLYWTQKAFVRLENGLSDEILIKRGVRQGCVLSPALFNLYTEMIFRVIDDMDGVKIGGLNINNLRYADDTVLIAEIPEQLQEIIDKINEEGKLYGMKINAEKTKTMLISKVTPSAEFHITVDNGAIKEVDSFVYLGQLLTQDAKFDKEILRRTSIARGTFNKMKSTLTNRNINLKTRKRILKCCV